MITFSNPGLIPLDAIRLMGASVKQEGSFGRFGTGFKYALATILRGGGSVVLWRGTSRVSFKVREVNVRGETFAEVVMVDHGPHDDYEREEPLGFTTQLGKDWEAWMALRELACNARDEDGEWGYIHPDDFEGLLFGQPDDAGTTTIIVDWPEMDAAALDGGACVFAPEGEPLLEERGVRVLPGPSKYLYHRGVRVWELPKPSVFTYDITKAVDLTEDRTVKYGFWVTADVRNMILNTEDRSIIEAAVSAPKETWERTFDWSGAEWGATEPGSVWLEVVADGREQRGDAVSRSARDVLLKHRAFSKVQRASWQDVTGANEALSDAAEAMEEMGFDLEKVDVYVVDELPGGALSSVKGGSVFITRELLDMRRTVVVRELLARFLEREGEGDHDTLLKAVARRFYELAKVRVYWLGRDERLLEEEVKAGAVEPQDMVLDF